MHERAIVLARPERPRQLVLLFHGVGSSAANLVPLGEAIVAGRPDVAVVSVDAPHASTLGSGREWFSVVGITEANRPERIARAMPLFLEAAAHWQRSFGLGAADTTLVGFSQGAILALESTQADEAPAHGVVALAGRFAQGVRRTREGLRYHLVHGEQDPVVPARFSVEAAQALRERGANVTLDLLAGLGHGIDARALQLVLRHVDAAD